MISFCIFHLVTIFILWILAYRYNKTEDLTPGSNAMMSYTHLCVGASHHDNTTLQPYRLTHNILSVIHGFSGISLREKPYIKLEPKIYVMERRNQTWNQVTPYRSQSLTSQQKIKSKTGGQFPKCRPTPLLFPLPPPPLPPPPPPPPPPRTSSSSYKHL